MEIQRSKQDFLRLPSADCSQLLHLWLAMLHQSLLVSSGSPRAGFPAYTRGIACTLPWAVKVSCVYIQHGTETQVLGGTARPLAVLLLCSKRDTSFNSPLKCFYSRKRLLQNLSPCRLASVAAYWRPAYLRGNRGEAAAEMYVLMNLTAIGGQEPVPKGLFVAIRLIAVALVGQELGHVPVIRWCSSNQCNEDGFCGHIELKMNT